MKITQIRNATVKIEYSDKTFLVDPWLVEQGAAGVLADTPYIPPRPEMATIAMPIQPLPMAVEKVLAEVDAYVLTHVHPDHIDMDERYGTVGRSLIKEVPTFVQSVDDAKSMLKSGFTDVTVMYENSGLGDVGIIKTPGRHGTKIPCGPACGVIFQLIGEKTLYVAGDTIWYERVAETIEKFQPDVIIVNACAAELKFYGRLIMGCEDVKAVREAAPKAQIVISHMDNVPHATVSRADMRKYLKENNLEAGMSMPDDGQTLEF